jgi:hypothetical protein
VLRQREQSGYCQPVSTPISGHLRRLIARRFSAHLASMSAERSGILGRTFMLAGPNGSPRRKAIYPKSIDPPGDQLESGFGRNRILTPGVAPIRRRCRRPESHRHRVDSHERSEGCGLSLHFDIRRF